MQVNNILNEAPDVPVMYLQISKLPFSMRFETFLMIQCLKKKLPHQESTA